MSQARVYHVKKTRKAWNCSSCREDIPVGSPALNFAVGFRGRTQYRCSKAACAPTRADLESSAVGSIYAAIDSVDPSTFTGTDDFEGARDDIVGAIEEVADEYEYNEMYEINYDLQERAEMLRSAADELTGFVVDEEPYSEEDRFQDQDCDECDGTGQIGDEGDWENCYTCGGTGKVDAEEDYQMAMDDWLEDAREKFEDAISELELP